ncbi:major capsid protein [Sigmofec virus UA08Rod_5550]|uniref:Major capsid protein n=1 Tax=Sigmofec virus UA08Rod_5550 TaxID=2929429 RepID=A0A976N1E2_9VIRU|nr:major capsid protein [Sigmofec virus UA08Rod_5550]
MESKFSRLSDVSQNVHFSQSLMGEVEKSRMVATPVHLTTFNAGDIVPIYCREILPGESISMKMDFVLRQTTLLTPTMGNMECDIFAFFVPNRIVNQSWKAVEGENYSGSWTANSVSLCPLVSNASPATIQIPVGSVADYYGFPTQKPIPSTVLKECHDLKFRGYVMIYNEHFRDQNYQPPIPMSTLNVYQDFLNVSGGNTVNLSPTSSNVDSPITLSASVAPSGSPGPGAVAHALYGSGRTISASSTVRGPQRAGRFFAVNPPLKANKLHDYFTTVLPSPQKSQSEVLSPVTGSISSRIPVTTGSVNSFGSMNAALQWYTTGGTPLTNNSSLGVAVSTGSYNETVATPISFTSSQTNVIPANLSTVPDAPIAGLTMSINDLRMAAAVQQFYEILARGGSRYREFVSSFFGIDVDDPFSDTPVCLGRIRRSLDLYQTAQTSSSESGNTPQGNLAAFGYTSSSGELFNSTFVEHGFLHILCVVRHKNVYSSYLSRDNFRLSALDFYTPPLANISEQPVYTREINPFVSDPDSIFGYQEAWAEYRYEPDQVSGLMRPMPTGSESLSLWNYADNFDDTITISNGNWLKSNSQEVLDRTLAVTSSLSPQIKGQFKFIVDKVLPMPTYSVSGLDII